MESYAAAGQVWAAGLIFARVGALLMVIPGVGEQSVPPRIRLSFALLFALMLYPVLAPSMPALPGSVGSLAAQVIKEIAIGLVIGTILRIFMAALATAGEVVSLQTTLSFAQTASPNQAQPTASLSTFLGLLGLVLIMTSDLHHMFISAMVRSYALFPLVKPLPIADSAQLAIRTVGDSFALGIQLAAPVLVFSLVFNVATGLVGRVMPQFPVFFVASPIIVLLGLSIFALSLGAIGLVWVDRYRQLADVFV
ncbi:MAG: flagellar biosynthetic protein FliR [Phenylobacterium sp.]|jgi:flagellar biosynthetic protein FliR|uniref:flagellar biosynthetic protein FliR n=1 Tax=Phenylobacterium sp. TaxID=1871053 RepID=UPI002A36AF02|nr:flagellar biosynthetic protein FliR [Phenylobacterium sp.]MDX9999040.1 flagellar biosynthetic protein FliR [Phenylobacterium sp.]